MQVSIHFHSYFKDLTGCAETVETIADGSAINDLLRQLITRFPQLAGMQKSMLIAVGVEYQDRAYVLKPGDEISFFPPVRGG